MWARAQRSWKGSRMSVIQHLWRSRRVRVAGAVDQIAVDRPADLAAIYQEYWDLVYRRCLATLGDEQAAEDATQDVFLLALANFDQVHHDIVRGLLEMARSISYERRRRPAREVCLPNPPHLNGNSEDPADIAERHGELTAVWSGLSRVERRYVADKFAGFSFEEIAKRNRRKLGTVSSNLYRAREHARSLRGAPALLGLAGWRRLTALSHRARNAAHSSATTAGAQPVGAFTLSVTLAGLIAGAAPALTALPATGGVAALPATAAPRALAGSDAAAVPAAARGGIAVAAPGNEVAEADQPGASAHRSGGAVGLPAPASSETPEDTTIDTATPSPNYEQDHTIVALGYGRSCACNVLLRSTDGGATWQARTGAPTGDQIALPPAYPQDARIFVGSSFGASSTSDWWAPSFDSAFQPLPVAAGPIALPAGFDAGDPRVIASTPSGVWSFNMDTQVLQPLVVETKGAAKPALATPLGSIESGVLAMTSSQALTPGTAERAANASNGETLWDCPPGKACTPSAEVPLSTGGQLAAAPDYTAAPVLVAYTQTAALLSSDGGKSFTRLPLQDGTTSFSLVALGGTGRGPSMWIVARRGSGVVLEFAPSLGGVWHEVDQGLPQITTAPGRVVTLGRNRAMYLASGGGFVCTDDGGAHWASRCPATMR